MIAKYHVEYAIPLRRHSPTLHYQTDDPVACQEFLAELLERGFRVAGIKHEGVPLDRAEFDKMVKTAAGVLAAKHICASLGIKAEEEHYRFGFTA